MAVRAVSPSTRVANYHIDFPFPLPPRLRFSCAVCNPPPLPQILRCRHASTLPRPTARSHRVLRFALASVGDLGGGAHRRRQARLAHDFQHSWEGDTRLRLCLLEVRPRLRVSQLLWDYIWGRDRVPRAAADHLRHEHAELKLDIAKTNE
jgi:hypothetical protein